MREMEDEMYCGTRRETRENRCDNSGRDITRRSSVPPVNELTVPMPTSSMGREKSRASVHTASDLNVNPLWRTADSLDQNPPEAAKAGAVRHFARVRYSHFLLDRARATLLPDSLPSSSSSSSSSSPVAATASSTETIWSLARCRQYLSVEMPRTLAHTRHAGRRCSSSIASARVPPDTLSDRSRWTYHR